MPKPPDGRDIAALRQIMSDLRNREGGCPWDLEQTFATIAPYTVEEAYEVADAIERGALDELKDELGDLLLQVVYHAQIASEIGQFDFDDVVTSICGKMIRRHPHVYGEAAANGMAKLAKGFWEEIKAAERADAPSSPRAPSSALSGIARALPALSRAVKLQARAARVGFDWPDTRAVFDKAREEMEELEGAVRDGQLEAAHEEIGDLLFVCANLARHLGVDPEAALSQTNAKFMRRFAHIEAALAERGLTPGQSSLEEMDALWDEAKAHEKSGGL